MERANVKDVHDVEVIAKTLLDLEASAIQVADNIIKPNNQPDVTVFGEIEPVISEMPKTDLATSQEHLSTENESPIKELLLETSTVSQETLAEETSASSVNEQTETNFTSDAVVPESHVITEMAENVEPNLSEESSICTNQVVVEKMDIDSEVITSSVEPPKNDTGSIDEELVMVDMSDVGVVEEVLESEAKIESVESMQLGPESDTGLEKG